MTGYDMWKTSDPADESLGSCAKAVCIECSDPLEAEEGWRPTQGLCRHCEEMMTCE